MTINLFRSFIAWLRSIFSPKKKGPQLSYFLPGEVVVQIRHPEATPEETPEESPRETLDERRKKMQANVLSALQNFLQPSKEYDSQELPPEQKWRGKLNAPQPDSKILTFPFADDSGRIFSLVPVSISGYDAKNNLNPEEAISILRDAYAELKQNGSIGLGDNLSIDGFSPNWLTSDLHHGAATGGPGGRPVQAGTPQVGPRNFHVRSSVTTLFERNVFPANQNQGFVAILDTALTEDIISDASHRIPNFAAFQNLFRNLTFHRLSLSERTSLEHFSPALHNYEMPDHGTFIAYIINTFAPNATLHLYEVLNKYGVGSFISVAQRILEVIDNPTIGRPLVINCSFMFCLPEGDEGQRLADDLNIPFNRDAPPELWTKTMREVFEGVNHNKRDIAIVASSGNNSRPRNRMPASYPAAFGNVIGVGALPKNSQPDANGKHSPASYSNYADEPRGTGFMTLGGEPGEGLGVLGMYLSREFPNGDRNDEGLSWWAGTSFAAAIISGILASNQTSPAISTPSAVAAPDIRSVHNEQVILVDQS